MSKELKDPNELMKFLKYLDSLLQIAKKIYDKGGSASVSALRVSDNYKIGKECETTLMDELNKRDAGDPSVNWELDDESGKELVWIVDISNPWG